MRRWRCSPVRVGIECRQLYTYHFIEKATFLQYVFKQSALYIIACLISSQQWSANKAEQQILLVHSLSLLPQKKKSRGVKWGATYCYDWVRAGQLVPVRGTRTLIHAHNSGTTCLRVGYMFLHKKLSSLHGLSSISFCRWGPVTPCIWCKKIHIQTLRVCRGDKTKPFFYVINIWQVLRFLARGPWRVWRRMVLQKLLKMSSIYINAQLVSAWKWLSHE